MNFFKRIFKKKREQKPKQLRIDGCKTTMTPQPDDAELAAQALLENLSEKEHKGKAKRNKKSDTRVAKPSEPVRDAAYYRQLSEKIRASRAAEARLTMRYLAYCEEQLALPKELYVGQIGEMEQELYNRQTVAQREGGKLLRRWQHCLAEVIVRQMSAAQTDDHNTIDEDTAADGL